jgi:hypothetical protein
VTPEELELLDCPDYAAWCDERRAEWLAALDEEEMEVADAA